MAHCCRWHLIKRGRDQAVLLPLAVVCREKEKAARGEERAKEREEREKQVGGASMSLGGFSWLE